MAYYTNLNFPLIFFTRFSPEDPFGNELQQEAKKWFSSKVHFLAL